MISKPLVILWLILSLVAVSRGQIPCYTGSWETTNPPNPTVISLLPTTKAGVYSAADVVTVSNTTGNALMVWDSRNCSLVYSGSSPKAFSANTLTAGFYAVQGDIGNGWTDRNHFGVLSAPIYALSNTLIATEGVTSPDNATNRWNALKGMIRFHINGSAPFQMATSITNFNWASMDAVLAMNPIPKKIVTMWRNKPDWMPFTEADFINTITNYHDAFMSRYGPGMSTNGIIGIEFGVNEPYSGRVPGGDDYWNSNTLYRALVHIADIRDVKAPGLLLIGPNYNTEYSYLWSNGNNSHYARLTNNIGLARTAGSVIDVHTFHRYPTYEAPDIDYSGGGSNSYASIPNMIAKVRGIAGNTNALFAFTEDGWFVRSEIGATNNLNSSVGTELGVSRGLKQIIFAKYDKAPFLNFHSLEGSQSTSNPTLLQDEEIYGWGLWDRGVKLKTISAIALDRQLHNAVPVTRTNVGPVWLHTFASGNTTSTWVFCQEGTTTNLTGKAMFDVFGVPASTEVGATPAFFTVAAEEPAPPAPTAWWGPVSP